MMISDATHFRMMKTLCRVQTAVTECLLLLHVHVHVHVLDAQFIKL